MATPKKPTHVIRVKARDTNKTSTVGKAWLNDDGSVSISLDPAIVLRRDDPFFITAFPTNNDEERERWEEMLQEICKVLAARLGGDKA